MSKTAARPSFATQIAVDQTGPADHYSSQVPPQATGNANPIAYGGCAIAIAIRAACETVDPRYHVFSVLGSFLGPSRIDQLLHCQITRVRDTRTFATRSVLAYQTQADGGKRPCGHMFIDFHVREPALLTYNPPLPKQWGSPLDKDYALPARTILENAVAQNKIPANAVAKWRTMFSMFEEYFESTTCLHGVSGQNAIGLDKVTVTSQDHLPIYEKTAADWTHVQKPLATYQENVAALGFLMDAGLSFLPLHLSHRDFADSSACSTLDFALRILSDNIDVSEWMLRERHTKSGEGARTYSESNLWTESGRLIAVMTQTSILRPPKEQGKL